MEYTRTYMVPELASTSRALPYLYNVFLIESFIGMCGFVDVYDD